MSKVAIWTIIVLSGALVHGLAAVAGEAAWDRYALGIYWITATLLTVHFAGARP